MCGRIVVRKKGASLCLCSVVLPCCHIIYSLFPVSKEARFQRNNNNIRCNFSTHVHFIIVPGRIKYNGVLKPEEAGQYYKYLSALHSKDVIRRIITLHILNEYDMLYVF